MGNLITIAQLAALPVFQQRVAAGLIHNALIVLAETTNDVQTITITGSPTGGTFTLTYQNQTTAALNYNCTSGDVQTALSVLSNIGTGNVSVTGGPLPGTGIVVTFQGAMGNVTQTLLTHSDSFTGGSSPAVSIAHTTPGVSVALHTARAVFGQKVLNNPTYYAALISTAVADSDTVSGDYDSTGALTGGATEATTTTHINAQIVSIWNNYI